MWFYNVRWCQNPRAQRLNNRRILIRWVLMLLFKETPISLIWPNPWFSPNCKIDIYGIWLTFLCETIILYFTPSSGGNPVCSIKDTHVQYFLLNKSANGKESGNGEVSYLRCVCSRLACAQEPLELLNLADFFFFFFTLLFLRFFFFYITILIHMHHCEQ